VSGGHVVRPGGTIELLAPSTGWASAATGYRRGLAIGEDERAIHTGFVINELDADGSVPWHVHSFEESFYVLAGAAVIDTAEGSFRLTDGGYGVVPIGMPPWMSVTLGTGPSGGSLRLRWIPRGRARTCWK